MRPPAPAPSCKTDWHLCTDNSDLVNNNNSIISAQVDCKSKANDMAKFGPRMAFSRASSSVVANWKQVSRSPVIASHQANFWNEFRFHGMSFGRWATEARTAAKNFAWFILISS
jgi:hypothetical protein